MYDILCTADENAPTLSHQTTVFMMSHPLKAWNHSPCIRHHTHCIYVITLSLLTSHPLLYDTTPTFCVTSYELYITSQPILMSSHYSTYDITASIYETTSSMRATYTLNMWHDSHYLGHHTHSIDNITPLFLWHHIRHMCGIVCIIQDITSSILTSNHHFEDITPTILDIMSTVSVSSHQLYRW